MRRCHVRSQPGAGAGGFVLIRFVVQVSSCLLALTLLPPAPLIILLARCSCSPRQVRRSSRPSRLRQSSRRSSRVLQATAAFLPPRRSSRWCGKGEQSARPIPMPVKYVAKFRPSTLNRKVIGDKGASGKYVRKIVRYSATTYYSESVISILTIKTGGKEPNIRVAKSCTGASQDIPAQWTNITSDKTGRRKRYSFVFTYIEGLSE
ncbi:unnamed protein product [Closterium sp. Yama58-4]|nr:unnamed protein product [Closterium sp. Yama58-4]